MPAYNAEQYVAEAIQSVLNQTYSFWELLIINDGSTDYTKEKIQAFKDARIRYFAQPNRGVSAARNVGLANMRGDYFCFLDADDVMPQKGLESRLRIFFSNPKISFVDGRVLVKDIVLRKVVRVYQPTFRGNPSQALINLNESCFFGPSWMVKHEEGQTYQFREELTHGEDLLFYLSIAYQGLYAYTTEEVLWYRTGNHSAMTNLRGLEQGYVAIYHYLKDQSKADYSELLVFRRKIRSTMAKSYLGHKQPINAIRSFYELSRL